MCSERPRTDWMLARSCRPTVSRVSGFPGASSRRWCVPSSFKRYWAVCPSSARKQAASSQTLVMRMAGSTSAHNPQKMHLPRSSVTLRLTVRPVGSSTNSIDRKSTRLNSSHLVISYDVFCLKKNKNEQDGIHALADTINSHQAEVDVARI